MRDVDVELDVTLKEGNMKFETSVQEMIRFAFTQFIKQQGAIRQKPPIPPTPPSSSKKSLPF